MSFVINTPFPYVPFCHLHLSYLLVVSEIQKVCTIQVVENLI